MEEQEQDVVTLQFYDMGLDDRLLEAIARMRWKEPTLIQEKAIPLALKGKDILAKARTGTGKTGAFLIPLIQKLLEEKSKDVKQVTKALILVPTKELCKQTSNLINDLTCLCKREVRCVDVSLQMAIEAQRPLLSDNPDIVVGTPSKIIKLINANYLYIKESLQYLVIDEADLMFTFDYETDLTNILCKIPTICQTFMTSATLGDEVKELKSLILHQPVILRLKEPPLPTHTQLTHYVMKVDEFEKAVMLYSLFRLNMMRGKTIIFVNTVDKGYKIRLFLHQFGIKSCILNSNLPVESRCHIVDEFNKGKYTILITSDEEIITKEKRKKNKNHDSESGVSRGVDFHFVSNIVNFDFPRDTNSYIHHVGRTARGDSEGTALSFVSVSELKLFQEIEKQLMKLQPENTKVFKDFKFDMASLDGFKYRANDVWKRCTSIAIKDSRKLELKQEILNSGKLQSFFQDHPKDLEAIKHDVTGKCLSEQPHLKNVPDYNIPTNLKKFNLKVDRNTARSGIKKSKKKKHSQIRKEDPLKGLKFKGFKKK